MRIEERILDAMEDEIRCARMVQAFCEVDGGPQEG
jgi:hypothetical protein